MDGEGYLKRAQKPSGDAQKVRPTLCVLGQPANPTKLFLSVQAEVSLFGGRANGQKTRLVPLGRKV